MANKGKGAFCTSRERTKLRIRKKVSGTSAKPRLAVFKSAKHTYAQLVVDDKSITVLTASTLQDAVSAKIKPAAEGNKSSSSKSVAAAHAVGFALAEKAKEKGISEIVFDRGGFRYHGRIKAVAEGAREAGLKF